MVVIVVGVVHRCVGGGNVGPVRAQVFELAQVDGLLAASRRGEGHRHRLALLPRLNFTDDPNLEAMRAEVEAKLIGHHPDALRNNLDLRQDAALEAKAIMDKMSVFMNGL